MATKDATFVIEGKNLTLNLDTGVSLEQIEEALKNYKDDQDLSKTLQELGLGNYFNMKDKYIFRYNNAAGEPRNKVLRLNQFNPNKNLLFYISKDNQGGVSPQKPHQPFHKEPQISHTIQTSGAMGPDNLKVINFEILAIGGGGQSQYKTFSFKPTETLAELKNRILDGRKVSDLRLSNQQGVQIDIIAMSDKTKLIDIPSLWQSNGLITIAPVQKSA